MMIAVSANAQAQGTSIHNRYGESGSHFALSASQPFVYEATISGFTAPYGVQLEVYHNGMLKHMDQVQVQDAPPMFVFHSPVEMSTWNLRSGDVVTFVLRVIDPATGGTLASHCLHGEVGGP